MSGWRVGGLGGSGLHNPEERLKRVEKVIHDLLMNPSIDNARRGLLQIPNADVLPGNNRNVVLQVNGPIQILPSAGTDTVTNGFDATAGWPFLDLQMNASLGQDAAIAAQIVAAVIGTAGVTVNHIFPRRELLPDMRAQVAIEATPPDILQVGFLQSSTQDATPKAVVRAVAGGNWHAVTRDSGGMETSTDLGIAPTTAPQLIQVRFPTTTQVEFLIGGTLRHRETATLPTNIITPAAMHRVTDGNVRTLRVSRWLAFRNLIQAA